MASSELLDSMHGSYNSNRKSINDTTSKSSFRVPPAGFNPVVTAAPGDGSGSELTQLQRQEEEQGQRDPARDLELSSSAEHRPPIAPLQAVPVDAERRGGGVGCEGTGGGGAGEGPRQLEVWDLLWECDFYHLALTMLCTGVSGLYIAGTPLSKDDFTTREQTRGAWMAFAVTTRQTSCLYFLAHLVVR